MPNKILPLFLCLLLINTSLMAQKKTGAVTRKSSTYKNYNQFISLKDDPSPVKNLKLQIDTFQFKPRRFYISQINDSTNTNDSIGFILQPKSGKRQRVGFEGGTKAFYTECFDKKLKKDSTLIPLVFNVKKFDITDERETPYDKTTIKYKYEFLFPYKGKFERVASYTGEGFLYTPIGMKKNFDSIILTGLERQFSSLDEMLDEMNEKSPMFCKGVKVNVKLRTGENADTVFYDSYTTLGREDFKGDSRNASNTFGSYIGLAFDINNYNYTNNYYNLDVSVAGSFIRSESWIGREVKEVAILVHMNYRLKLAHLYALKLKKRIEQASFTCEDFNTELRTLYTNTYKDLNAEMQKFDRETQYGQSKKEEKAWEKDIDIDMDELLQKN